MFFVLCSFLQLLDSSWWLKNTGQSYGLEGEDINYTTIGNLNGSSVTICAMADGARFDHQVYTGRAVEGEFLDGFENVEELVPPNPSENFVGQKALGLAAGSHDNVCSFDGTAPGANVMSIDFYNASGRQESLQYIVCHHSDVWDISLLLYKEWYCEERRCKYIPSDNIMREMAGECLYNARGGDVRKFITPAGNDDKLTDVFFTPPTRWPLMFVVSAVSNRGIPINRGSEGAGIFIACPGTRMDQDTPPGIINYALPQTNSSCNEGKQTSFEYANASASIFAGAMAIVMEVKKDMSLADVRYLFAMTSTVVNPYSKLWNKNSWGGGVGLYFNRRCGFGRVNLGQAVELAKKWKKDNFTVGDFGTSKVTNTTLLQLSVYGDGDPRSKVPFVFDSKVTGSEDPVYVLVMNVEISAKVLGFGSLIVHLISPSGTRCELKFLTEESALNSNVEKLELPSSQFLGEPLYGEWTVEFPKRDGGDRGIITSITVEAFYSYKRPDIADLSQVNGSDPYQPLDESIVEFEQKTLTMVARTTISWKLNWKNDPQDKHKKCAYNTWLQREGQRVKLKTTVDPTNTTYTLSFVPSVFKNATEMNLTMESLYGECGGWSATVPVLYLNEMDEPEDRADLIITKYKDYDNPYPMKNGKFVIPMADWKSGGFSVKWNQTMSEILDDGYSCSACLTMITIDTGRISRRTFERNLGEADFDIKENGEVPGNSEYLIELSPSSAQRENFRRKQVRVVIQRDENNRKPYKNPFTLQINIGILIILSANFVFVGTRIYSLNRRRRVDDDRPLDTDVNVDEVQ